MKVNVTNTVTLVLNDKEARCLWDISNQGTQVAEAVAEYGSRSFLREPIDTFLEALWEVLDEQGVKGLEYEKPKE